MHLGMLKEFINNLFEFKRIAYDTNLMKVDYENNL